MVASYRQVERPVTAPTLFLDIDGVLHPYGTPVLSGAGYTRWDLPEIFLWRPLLEAALEPYPDVAIVISSSWRFMCDDGDLRNRVLGPRLASRFAGITGDENGGLTRAEEVLECVDMHELTRWVALDDDETVKRAESEERRFVWCPPDRGIAHPTALMRLRRRLQEMTR